MIHVYDICTITAYVFDIWSTLMFKYGGLRCPRSNILLGLQSKLWKKCTKDSAGKGVFVKYKVYVHMSVATISTCRFGTAICWKIAWISHFLPIFTFISGRLAATCNLKIMKKGPPSLANVWKSSTSRFFFSNGPMENRSQVNSIAGSFLHRIPKVAGYKKTQRE